MKKENKIDPDYLFDAYLTGDLTEEQRKELLDILESPEIEMRIQGEMMKRYEAGEELVLDPFYREQIGRWLERQMHPEVKVHRLNWLKYAAAVIIFLSVTTFGYQFFWKNSKKAEPLAGRYKNDIRPDISRAVLKLSDGQLIELDLSTNGRIAVEGSQKGVKKNNGIISYDGFDEVTYHDIVTATASKIQIELADGTKVWLDAQSSIHFPTAFTGNAREVEIKGQAYFEIANDASRPFIVTVREQKIQVLGTEFNVNSYDNEPTTKTTLLKGSIRVSSNGKELVLKPGEQAEGSKLNTSTDLDETIAWKNGIFRFNGVPIKEIMTQVARWYGAEIKYKDQITEEFVAKIDRDVPVSELLKMLEATNQVHFEIDGKTITVSK